MDHMVDETRMESRVVDGVKFFTDGKTLFTQDSDKNLKVVCPFIEASGQVFDAFKHKPQGS